VAEPKFPAAWSSLKLPQWRCELMETLQELADPGYQQKAWIEGKRDKDKVVGAQQVYHSLFDDLDLRSDAQGAIGKFLFDEVELAAVTPVVETMFAICEELGQPTSAACLVHPLWPQVVAAAAAARGVLAQKGEMKPA
jgi:hypothetical protein